MLFILCLILVQQTLSSPASVHNEDPAWRYRGPMYGGDSEGFCSRLEPSAPNRAQEHPLPVANCDSGVAMVAAGRRSNAGERLSYGVVNDERQVRTGIFDDFVYLTSSKALLMSASNAESMWWFLIFLKWGQLLMGLGCLIALFSGIILKILGKP